MGNVVRMPEPRRNRADPGRSKRDATILFFMGVRYVRDGASADRPVQPTVVDSDHGQSLGPSLAV